MFLFGRGPAESLKFLVLGTFRLELVGGRGEEGLKFFLLSENEGIAESYSWLSSCLKRTRGFLFH